MLSGQPSQTMLRSAIRRAAHQLLDDPLIFNDPIIIGLVPEAYEPSIRNTLDDVGAPDPKLLRYMFAMRSRFAEDHLAQAVARGVRQYVMVGAGLDTFPWRQPDFAKTMQIFAADHPASLAWTNGRLRQHGLSRPSNLTYVPVNLEERRLGDQLLACGFDGEAESFCSVLGVTQYLNREAVDALFAFAAALAKGSEIVFSFAPPDDQNDPKGRNDLLRTAPSSRRALEEPIARLRSRGATNGPWIQRHLPFDAGTGAAALFPRSAGDSRAVALG